MFDKIMAPVDLAHPETQGKAMQCAADLARRFGAEVCYVGVTTETPGPLGRSPAEFTEKLKNYAEEQAAAHGHTASHLVEIAHDPTADLDDALVRAVERTGADLVVMATHMPSLGDALWPANCTKVACHTRASVFMVRGD